MLMKEQGQIHGKTVADGWAGAILIKSLAIQDCDGRIYLLTDMAGCRVTGPRLKTHRHHYILTLKIQIAINHSITFAVLQVINPSPSSLLNGLKVLESLKLNQH